MTRKNTVLDMVKTGENIKNIMLSKGLTVRNIQAYLQLSTPQSIYHWFDGSSMPTVDNLYALSDLFCMPVDSMLVGNREYNFEQYNLIDGSPRILIYYSRQLYSRRIV